MADQYKNMMIALFVFAATGVIVFILLFIHPSVGDEQKKLIVRFADIDKVSLGTRVTYGGQPVGEVVSIRDIPGEKDHRDTRGGKVYLYEVDLLVDSSVRLFQTDEISLRTSGLLGEKSIAITPVAPQPGQKLRSIDREVIYANDSGSVEQTFKDFKEIADKFDRILDNANRIIEQMEHDKTFKNAAKIANNVADITEALRKPKEISEIVDNLHSLSSEVNASWKRIDRVIDNVSIASDHLREITAAIDHPNNLSETVDNIHILSQKAIASWDTIDSTLADLSDTASNAREISAALNQPEQLEGIVTNVHQLSNDVLNTWPKFDHVATNLSGTSSKIYEVVDHVYQGKGSVGRFVMNDDFYLRTQSLFNKAEVLANDVNHYGLLFHLDKGWQRLRSRRLNLLGRLRTPQEFRNYFNDEIDKTATSLSRIEMILEKNENAVPAQLLLDDKEFVKVYGELLRRVESIEEALKMYNQQAVDQQLFRTELEPSRCCR